MKQRSKKIIASAVAFIPFLAAVVPHFAFADVTGTVISWIANDTIWLVTSLISQLYMGIAGGLVAIAGILLNATMTATLNISAIVDSTPAVGIAWTTVRDFGSVFIIFMLLDASARMILGIGSGVGKLIKNIVIAGLLINFSLFFTKLAVDASNIISLSFYNAIAPTGLQQSNGTLTGVVSGAFSDGGLSNIFMQSLDLQAVANSASSTGASSVILNGPNKYWNITLANIGAAILMTFAAISFFAASLAFAIRIGVLIMLMAFSPVYFIALIFPDLKKYADKWTKMLYSMCVFMPVYLFLMYVAMSVLNDPHFFCFAQTSASSFCPGAGNNTNVTGGLIGGLIGPALIGTVLQYIIAIFLIDAPLFAAISIAGEGADFMSKMMKNVSKWGQGAITGAQKRTAGFMGQHSIGRGARMAADSEGFKSFVAKNPLLGTFAARGLKGVAGSSFGGTKGGFDKRTEKYSKAHQDVAKSLALSDSEVKERATLSYYAYLKDTKAKKDELTAEEARMASPDLSDDDKRYAAMGAENLRKEIEEREKKKESDFVKTEKEKYQKEYATNLEKDFVTDVDTKILGKFKVNWTRLTKEGREDAVDKIRKGLNKSKKDKLADDLKALIPDEDKGGDKK